jgi:hypothetical protein
MYRSTAFAAAMSIATSMMTYAQGIRVGDTAPKFSVTSMAGKQIFFQDMQTGGPLFIYFIRDGDPVSQQMTSYVNKMIRAYGGVRSTWYGVLNAKEDRARSYQAETDPAFRLERDENMSAAKMFGIANSPTIMEFDGNGTLMHTWKGLSGPNLKGINMEYAAANHKSMQDLDFTRAPSTLKFGIDYHL